MKFLPADLAFRLATHRILAAVAGMTLASVAAQADQPARQIERQQQELMRAQQEQQTQTQLRDQEARLRQQQELQRQNEATRERQRDLQGKVEGTRLPMVEPR